MAELSRQNGISTDNIRDWFNHNKSAQPSADALVKISKALDCSVDYLLGLTDVEKLNVDVKIYCFPVYGQQAAAGGGITGRYGKFTMESIFADDIPKNAVFGVHIKGTSMINIDSPYKVEDIPDNSFVLLNPRVSVSDLNKTIDLYYIFNCFM